MPDKKGIEFENNLSWEQVLSEAKAANKFIFLDCYATWCTPCKLMDKNVYPKEDVGEFMNSHFISVKVQLDSSKVDNEFVRKWYKNAHFIMQHYQIEKLPTFLFFSPDGKIIHRVVGFLSDSLFLIAASNALDSQYQYYTNLNKYQLGNVKYSSLLYLANQAKINGDSTVANLIANDYLHNYLDVQPKNELYRTINYNFMLNFLYDILTTRDQFFLWIYNNSKLIDEKFKTKGISQSIIDRAITRDYINIYLGDRKNNYNSKNSDLDWNKMERGIAKVYDKSYGQRLILNAKLNWYIKMNKWDEITKYTIEKIERFGYDTSGFGISFTNNILYGTIFMHSTKQTELKKAAKWMKDIVSLRPTDPNLIDTYANLLYKSGNSKNGIEMEKRAQQLEDEHAKLKNRDSNGAYRENLDKMIKGQPTW